MESTSPGIIAERPDFASPVRNSKSLIQILSGPRQEKLQS